MSKTKIKINESNNTFNIFVYQEEELVEEYSESLHEKRIEGNIYLGKVENVIKGMQVAFINIGYEKNGLIHLKDLLPKESDITGNENIDVSKYDISKIVKTNEEIIVQVKRDSSENKGPKLTRDIKLIGEYVILMPYSNFVTISKKIEDKEERKRLVSLIKEDYQGYGIIVRTSAFNKEYDTIKDEIEKLIDEWEKIIEKTKNVEAPMELYNNKGIIGKLITDFEPNNLEIHTNSDIVFNNVKDNFPNVNIKKSICEEKIEPYKKVWLKCGGFITIDETEALVAIDVNSGKYTGKKQLEDTVLKVNKEAAIEIAKQIRLHDLGGIIIIDFIDMENDEERFRIKEIFEKELKKDRSKVQVVDFTKLGLLELTRKQIFKK